MGFSQDGRAIPSDADVGARPTFSHGFRHLGLVLGIVALTPIFTHQLGVQQEKVQQQGMQLLLDSPLPITTRLGLGGQLSGLVDSANGRIPNISEVFANAPTDPQQLAAWNALEANLQSAIRNAGTAAAAWPFLAAAGLVLLALVPIVIGRRHLDL